MQIDTHHVVRMTMSVIMSVPMSVIVSVSMIVPMRVTVTVTVMMVSSGRPHAKEVDAETHATDDEQLCCVVHHGRINDTLHRPRTQ